MSDFSRGGDPAWALFYPADYSVGASNLGFHYVYAGLKRLQVGVERFFSSPVPFRSVESDASIRNFSILSAGISHEGDLRPWVEWLTGIGIRLDPLERRARGEPLVGAGGAQTSINPLPLGPFCDFVVLGDAESVLPFLVERLRRGGDREALWAALAEHPSIWVPPIEGESLKIPRYPAKYSTPCEGEGRSLWVSPRAHFGSALLLELQRGCVRHCPYCVLPSAFAPARITSANRVLALLDESRLRGGFDRVGLVTPEASDHPEIEKILEATLARGLKISFASLRVDGLTDSILEALARSGRRELTLAPEAGTDRLRRAAGKEFSNDLLVSRIRSASTFGVTEVKLYFMIGLPGETEEDLEAIASLGRRILDETGVRPTLAVSPFVPKPTSAWRRAPFAGERELKRRIDRVRRAARDRGGLPLRSGSPRQAEEQFRLAWATSRSERDLMVSGISAGNLPDREGVIGLLEDMGVLRRSRGEEGHEHP
jgi:radical SAM superfamily enzyme YgiQ (UPF0313 family)